MTGKGCVYTDRIQEVLDSRSEKRVDGDLPACSGFVIMPFRPSLKVFFQNSLRPFFLENYGPRIESVSTPESRALESRFLETADQVSRPGIVICEGICRRIQEADFVVADISIPNENVFYELGLAYGIGHKIVVIYQENSLFGPQCNNNYFQAAGCNAYAYKDLGLIEAGKFQASKHIWRCDPQETAAKLDEPKICFFEMMRDGLPEKLPELPQDGDVFEYDDIRLTFNTHVESHVGLAMNRIYTSLKNKTEDAPRALDAYLGLIGENLQRAEPISPSQSLLDIKKQIDSAYCFIVRTGRTCHPMSYFWLGYSHARGKNVIPITVAESDKDGTERVVDLAFDIRATRIIGAPPRTNTSRDDKE
jgi:hypothetical protein